MYAYRRFFTKEIAGNWHKTLFEDAYFLLLWGQLNLVSHLGIPKIQRELLGFALEKAITLFFFIINFIY